MAIKKAIRPHQAEEQSPPLNLATLYSGGAQHAIDGSNRIMLLSDWRINGAPTQFFVMIVPSEDYLVACPPAVFEEFLAKLRAGTSDKSQIPQIEREVNDRTRRVSLDRFGRLPLPPDFMAKAHIEKQGELVGRFEKFEIWSCDRYKASQSERKLAVADSLKELQNL